MDKYVIYGASSGGIKVYQTLKSFNVDISFFVDGDEKKQGSIVCNKNVLSPKSLIDTDYKIIIASDSGYTSIKEKLRSINVEKNIIMKEKIIFSLVQKMDIKNLVVYNYVNGNKTTVLIELLEGYQLGGIENWSYMVAKGLKLVNIPVKILSKNVKEHDESWNEVLEDKFSGDYLSFKKCIEELCQYISQNLPCVIFANKQQQLLYAGYLSKKIYGDKVRIYSVVHNDIEAYYDRQEFFYNYVDGFMCVSKKIKETLKNVYNIDDRKIFYKETPVIIDKKNAKKIYTTDIKMPIKLAYGGRLEKAQKQANKLLPLINYLEKYKVNYKLTIAGDGICYKMIKNFIEKNGYNQRVKLLGNLEHSKMAEFWNNADIFINLSKYEGMPVSMLEAMYFGNVPVVFEASGNDEFIQNNINGYIIKNNDCQKMSEIIKLLDNNRDLIVELGRKSKQIIKSKCDYNDYINYIINKFVYVSTR